MSTTKSPAGQPKTLSSRLLTMKFMQRAAASPSREPAPEEPSPKRRKTEEVLPVLDNVDASADARAVQIAVTDDDAKQRAALDKQAAEAGDSRWVLNFENGSSGSMQSTFQVIQTGFASLDTSVQPRIHTERQPLQDNMSLGRRSFGQFKGAIEKSRRRSEAFGSEAVNEDGNESTDLNEGSQNSESELDGDDEISATSHGQVIDGHKQERRAKRKAEVAESQMLAKKRRKKDVKLNGPGRMSLTGRQDLKCFRCGGPHMKSDCPIPTGPSESRGIRDNLRPMSRSYEGSNAHGPFS